MKSFDNLSDGRDALDKMFKKMYPSSTISIITPCKCTRSESDFGESVLNNIIKNKIENKALPLTLRKRMLYEQARAS